MYEGPAVPFVPQVLEGPWSGHASSSRNDMLCAGNRRNFGVDRRKLLLDGRV